MAPVAPERPRWVYRIWDSRGRLTYVGSTVDVAARLVYHRARRHEEAWAGDIADVRADWHPNQATGFAAEREAIRAERPIGNVLHVLPEGSRRDRPPRPEWEYVHAGPGRPPWEWTAADWARIRW